MKLWMLLILSVLRLGLVAQAAPLMKLDSLRAGSRTYRNVTVLGASATDIYITHAEGIANIKLKYLPPELQRQFNYDPTKADNVERQQTKADSLYHAVVVSNLVAEAAQRREGTEAGRAAAATTSETSLADPVSEKSLLGKPGPALEVGKWLSAEPETNGRFLLTFFYAPWSIPCRKTIPDMNALQKKFADRVAFVALTSESETDIETMPGDKVSFASALDLKSKFRDAFGITSLPYVVLQDTNLVVRYSGHPGAINEKTLEKLLH
jgi:thiol-disulfide isomerase/thioredoxin